MGHVATLIVAASPAGASSARNAYSQTRFSPEDQMAKRAFFDLSMGSWIVVEGSQSRGTGHVAKTPYERQVAAQKGGDGKQGEEVFDEGR